jgi:hypothetical protein
VCCRSLQVPVQSRDERPSKQSRTQNPDVAQTQGTDKTAQTKTKGIHLRTSRTKDQAESSRCRTEMTENKAEQGSDLEGESDQ